jgi:transposase
MTKQDEYVGIDVSKKTLDVTTLHRGEHRTVRHDQEGIRSICEQLLALRPKLIVMEATGGYERELAIALVLAGLPVAVVNPRQVRDFARAMGMLAKTDKVDAGVLALFGERIKPEPRGVPEKEVRELDALITRRAQLKEMLTAEKNRMGVAPRTVRPSILEHVRWMESQVKELEAELNQVIQASPIWRAKEDLLTSVPGIGEVTAQSLIAMLPELGHVTAKRAAALVGIAPFARDSGPKKGKRSIWGGRASLRAALYMATLNAIRWNPVLRAHYKQLMARGKLFKVAMVACMRRLLTILDAMVRKNQRWTDVTLVHAP